MGTLNEIKFAEIFCKNNGLKYKMEISKFNDFYVNIDGDFHLKEDSSIGEFLFPLGIVTGNFDVSGKGLHSTKNFPKTVLGNFDASDNLLYEIKNMPECMGSINLGNNRIPSLYGIQNSVNGDLNVSGNCLKNYDGFPSTIKGSLFMSENWQMKEMTGIQKSFKVQNSIYISEGQISEEMKTELVKCGAVVSMSKNNPFKEINTEDVVRSILDPQARFYNPKQGNWTSIVSQPKNPIKEYVEEEENIPY